MKNQYLTDIGDYGKYGLLRFLASKGIRIGVNWYLTRDDGSNDGRFKKYLDKQAEKWMADDELFEELKRIKAQKKSTIHSIEAAGLIPQAVYYSARLDYSKQTQCEGMTVCEKLTPDERAVARDKWFTGSIPCLRQADLIFADPDNGISYRATPRTKNNEKYILPAEVAAYYKTAYNESGKDVVFYCHKGRRNNAAWIKVRTDLKAFAEDAVIFTLTYHKGTQRSYIFAVHLERAALYDRMLREFVESGWSPAFELEEVDV